AAAGWDAPITVAAAHGVAAGVEPSRRRTLRGRPGTAARGAAGPDAHALVLARAVDAPIHRAAVPVVAVEVAAAARPERRGGGRWRCAAGRRAVGLARRGGACVGDGLRVGGLVAAGGEAGSRGGENERGDDENAEPHGSPPGGAIFLPRQVSVKVAVVCLPAWAFGSWALCC